MWDRKSAKRLLNNTRRYRSGTVVIFAWRWPGSRDIIRVRKKRKEKGREEIMRKGENDLICHSDEVLCSALVPVPSAPSRDTTCVYVRRVPGRSSGLFAYAVVIDFPKREHR